MKLGSKLDISRVAASDLFDVTIQLPDGKDFAIADLGYGLSQVLPVLTQLCFVPTGGTLLFEQPELHLHPLAQRPLASVFVDAIHKKRIHIVAETHSPWLFGQFQRELREGNLATNEIALYRVRRIDGETRIEAIEVDAKGEIYHDWKSGFCD
jgi:predicted ATPase